MTLPAKAPTPKPRIAPFGSPVVGRIPFVTPSTAVTVTAAEASCARAAPKASVSPSAQATLEAGSIA